MAQNDPLTFLDKATLSALMKKMDKDVATRLAISAISLNPKKINEAVGIAFQEMAIRSKAKKAAANKDQSGIDTKAQARELVDAITALFKNDPNSLNEDDFEMEIIVPDDDEDEGKNS